MANCEHTFIAIKPDGVQWGLVGEIIKCFEQKGFCLVGLKFMQASEDLFKEHYIDLKDRPPFFAGLVKYMHSGPVVAMVWEGLNVVKTGLVMLGETNPADSMPGTIRGDFCIQSWQEHYTGQRFCGECKEGDQLWFHPEELVDYKSLAEKTHVKILAKGTEVTKLETVAKVPEATHVKIKVKGCESTKIKKVAEVPEATHVKMIAKGTEATKVEKVAEVPEATHVKMIAKGTEATKVEKVAEVLEATHVKMIAKVTEVTRVEKVAELPKATHVKMIA
ncbi:hypothetical protein P7K49_023020 [Saguinus oedipus]|uniref:nucleoside-diphosphate kinase n=1 Tax=Saguinus oedipus TaxID=9490 RepID=A0ABQ9UL91_SAGOE|nr:hypothetical protein P7K49_023020 [Saguinus oedipus]